MHPLTRNSLGLVLAALAAGAAAQDVQLTPAEIQSAWVGKKVFGRSVSGGLLDLHLHPDGTATVSVANMQDSGTWRLSADGYCSTWKKIRANEERCFTVVRRGSTVLVLNPDKSVGTEILRVTD